MSKLIKCPNGSHHYDAERFRECPYCAEKSGRSTMLPNAPVFGYETHPAEPTDEGVTVGKDLWQEIVLNPYRPGTPVEMGLSAEENSLTQGFLPFRRGGNGGFVTGWLVGIKGPALGKDFRLYSENNYIGRSHNNSVIVADDAAIEWEKHCSIIYDGKHAKCFYAIPDKGVIRLNGEILEAGRELKSGDRLAIGNSIFEFVPFCREGHTWGEGDLKTDE